MSRAPISAVPLLGECPERLADRDPELRFAGTRGFEAMQHRWPVENPDAYPLVAHRDPDGIPHPLGERAESTTVVSGTLGAVHNSPFCKIWGKMGRTNERPRDPNHDRRPAWPSERG